MKKYKSKLDKICKYNIPEGECLNDEEQRFATENSDLIYKFLNVKHFDEEDYYGLAAIGYIKAVMIFFRKTDKDIKFSSVAFLKMDNEISKYQRILKIRR